MCSIGHGANTQEKRENRARGTSRLGVIEGIVPPRSPRSLLAFGALVVTLVHDKNGGMKKYTSVACHFEVKQYFGAEVHGRRGAF